MNDELQRLARTPYKEMNFSDLWYYHHDLAYVELQPELFAYLFPACLMDWHHSLMRDEPCSHGDSEFHNGVYRGNVFEKMLTPQQREAVFEFFRDSFLERLDAECKFAQPRNDYPMKYLLGWIGRFNSLAIVMPKIETIWNAWWSLDTPGRAVAAIQYCSGLMYFDGENPVFEQYSRVSPQLWCDDSFIYDQGWHQANLSFLQKTLTADFVNDKISIAVLRLTDHPEFEVARRVENDLPQCHEVLEARINELPELLATPGTVEWTI